MQLDTYPRTTWTRIEADKLWVSKRVSGNARFHVSFRGGLGKESLEPLSCTFSLKLSIFKRFTSGFLKEVINSQHLINWVNAISLLMRWSMKLCVVLFKPEKKGRSTSKTFPFGSGPTYSASLSTSIHFSPVFGEDPTVMNSSSTKVTVELGGQCKMEQI